MKGFLEQDKNIGIIFAVTLISILGISPVTPAFPRIMAHFGLNPQRVGLLITVFALPGVILTPLYGVLADRLGRKKVLLFSLIVYGIAGTGCGIVNEYSHLLALRFFQGVGAAGLGSLNVTIIGDLYIEPERTKIMGYNSSVLSLGTAILPGIGGMLAQFSWRLPFFLNAFAFIVSLWTLKYLDVPHTPDTNTSLSQYLNGAFKAMASFQVIWLFTLSAVALMLIMGPYLNYFPILLSKQMGARTWEIGLIMAIGSTGSAVSAALVGRIRAKIGATWMVRLAFIGYIFTFILLATLKYRYLLAIPAVIFGISNGIVFPVLLSLVASHAPKAFMGAFMSFNGMVMRIAQVIGPVVASCVFSVWSFFGVFIGAAFFALLFLVTTMVYTRAFKAR